MSAPSISLPAITNLRNTSATLGATVTSNGGVTITGVGLVYSLTAVNAAPAVGGSGVTNVAAGSLAVAPFTISATSLTPGASYTFAGYATNGTGTTYTTFSLFATPSVTGFTTCAFTVPTTVFVTLKNRTDPEQIDFVNQIDAITQDVFTGTFRDIFGHAANVSDSFGAGETSFLLLNPSGAVYSSSDEQSHTAPRYYDSLESGLMFTTSTGGKFVYLWKDIYGWKNAVYNGSPTNVTS